MNPLNDLLSLIFLVFTIAMLLVAIGCFLRRRSFYGILSAVMVGARVVEAGLKTASQYWLWSNNPATQVFLYSPVDRSVPIQFLGNWFGLFTHSWGYFVWYAFGRFWLNALLSIAMAYLLYGFLKLLQHHKARFFDTGEVELGLLMALIVGWPGFIVFVPLVFVLVVVISLIRGLVYKEAYTTLGLPFIIASATIIFLGDAIIKLFHLGVLKV